jgi:hypothetical protein
MRHEADLEPIFLLAGCAERRARLLPRTRTALARADFEALSRSLARRRLLPLIGGRALECCPDQCPPEFAAAVAQARRAARARGLAVEERTRWAVERLATEGIPALPLKGPLLAAAAHGDLGLRDTRDVDLLVPRSRLAEAVRLLDDGSFRTGDDPLRANGLPDLHLALRADAGPSIELHWRIHWYEDDFSADMLARAEPGRDGLLRARPADLAASLLLYYARDGFHGIRIAADIAAWWDRHGGELEPAFLEAHARRYPELTAALTAAADVVERLTGTPATAWLGAAPAPRGRRIELAERLGNWSQVGDRDQLAANISLADGLLGPRGSGRDFARRQLRPREGAAPPHAVKLLGRYAIALWRVRGGRSWAPLPEPQ